MLSFIIPLRTTVGPQMSCWSSFSLRPAPSAEVQVAIKAFFDLLVLVGEVRSFLIIISITL